MAAVSLSVIIPVWNMASTVGPAVDSALDQGWDGSEVIVVDDGSTDGTLAALESYRDRIKLISQPHRGSSAAYNTGARAAASSSYLAFLDADDVWLPGMLSKTVALLEQDPGCVMAYANAAMIDGNGRDRGPWLPAQHHTPSLKEMLNAYWSIFPSMCVMRRSAFEAAGGFWEEPGVYRACADVYLMLRLRELGHFLYQPECLVVRRIASYRESSQRYAQGHKVLSRPICERYGNTGHRFVKRPRTVRYVLLFFRMLNIDPVRFQPVFNAVRFLLPPKLADILGKPEE